MQSYPTLRRWLAGAVTLLIFGAVLAVVLVNGLGNRSDNVRADVPAARSEGRSWPMFGGSLQRNLVNLVEKDIATEWSTTEGEQKNIKWSAKLGSKAYGGPVISGGKIFIGTNNDNPRDPKIKGDKGVIMCFDEATGKFLWQAVHDKLTAGQVNDWPREGICSSPFVEGNHLSYVSNRCEVVCRDTDGKEVWTLDMIKKLGVFPHNLSVCSPLLVGDTLFLITSNGVDEDHKDIPRPDAPSFIAVNKKDGTVLWKTNLPSSNLKPGASVKSLIDRGLVIMHGQWSNPVYTEVDGKGQIIFPGGDGWLYALDPKNGELIWKFDANPKDSLYALSGRGTRSDFIGTPVVHDNLLYIGVGQDPEHDFGVGHFWCVDVAKATRLGGDVSPELVAGDEGGVQKGKPNPNSAKLWHYGGINPNPPKKGRSYYFGRTLSTAAVHDGLCYIAELKGILHCLDARTGEHYWEHDTESSTWSSPYYVDGKVYLGTDKEGVFIFAPGKKKKLITQVEMDRFVRATPTAVNGVLYVMTENMLYAIKK
jgi:outer membrane protein assembly factor BamB